MAKRLEATIESLKPIIMFYLNDPHRRNRQAAHGSRFTVKFVRPPKGRLRG